MTKKKVKPDNGPATANISNCTFTAIPPNAEMLAAATAIARASEAHAIALQKAASILLGSNAPLLQVG